MLVSIAVVIDRAAREPIERRPFYREECRASDAAIFFKWTLGSHWPNADSTAVFLEKQFVTGANAQSTAKLVRHRDLSLACDSRLLFQNDLLFLLCDKPPYLWKGEIANGPGGRQDDIRS
jgi:hypothetical protein